MIDRMDQNNAHAYSYAFHNKTCALIEEPLFTVDNIETMKLVMGGEPMLLNPKNVHPFIGQSKAFVVFTANEIPWQNYPAGPFLNRSHIFHLQFPLNIDEYIDRDQFWTTAEQWLCHQHQNLSEPELQNEQDM